MRTIRGMIGIYMFIFQKRIFLGQKIQTLLDKRSSISRAKHEPIAKKLSSDLNFGGCADKV